MVRTCHICGYELILSSLSNALYAKCPKCGTVIRIYG